MGLTLSRCALLLGAAVLTSCTSNRSAPQPPRPLDRTADSIAVYRAVLSHLRRPETQRFVIEPERSGSDWGRDMVRERVPGVRDDTIADLAARPTKSEMPRTLEVGLPVEWFSKADWYALPGAKEDIEVRWMAFRRRFPGAAGWMNFSDVGFSRDGTEALLHVWQGYASLAGAGHLVLLRHTAGGWTVVRKGLTVVS